MRAVQSEVGMHIEFLLEELSAKVALEAILPKILSDDVSSDFHVFEGKQNLLKRLPERLKGYKNWLPPDDYRIMVLIDRDREDCIKLKAELEKVAHDAGLVTKSSATSKGNFQVVNRLAIEELEAWFFGDIEALQTAYPKVSKRPLRRMNQHPDAIKGGTHEALGRLLKQSSYHRGGLPKTVVAQNIAQHMEPNRNRSRSFQVFVEGLEACVGPGGLRN